MSFIIQKICKRDFKYFCKCFQLYIRNETFSCFYTLYGIFIQFNAFKLHFIRKSPLGHFDISSFAKFCDIGTGNIVFSRRSFIFKHIDILVKWCATLAILKII